MRSRILLGDVGDLQKRSTIFTRFATAKAPPTFLNPHGPVGARHREYRPSTGRERPPLDPAEFDGAGASALPHPHRSSAVTP